MKKETFIKRTKKAQERVSNKNAKRFLNKLIEKFNNSQALYKADYIGEVANFAWCRTQIWNNETGSCETIRITLP